MIQFLLSFALAMCAPQEPDTRVATPVVFQDQAIEMRSTWGNAEMVAARLRVRGPEGQLLSLPAVALGKHFQFRPATPLPPGTYTVEEHAKYGDDGRRVTRRLKPVKLEKWFTIGSFEVRAGSAPVLEGRQVLERTSDGFVGSIPAGARWVDVEVDGVGMVSRSSYNRVDTMLPVRCNCEGAWVRFPKRGPVRVRTVARMRSGAELVSPWTTFYGQPLRNPFAWGDTSRMETWSAVEVQPVKHDDTPECAWSEYDRIPKSQEIFVGECDLLIWERPPLVQAGDLTFEGDYP